MSNSQMDNKQMQQLQSMAWEMMEGQIFAWFNTLRTQVESSKNQNWRDPREAAEAAEALDAAGKGEQALQGAINDVNEGFIRLVSKYVEQHQNPQMSTDELTNELQRFIRKLHSPDLREALLLAVKEEYRDDVRAWFTDEIGMVFWGMVDMAEGKQTPEMWKLVSLLADLQGVEMAQIVAQVDGLNPSAVPEEYR